MGEGRELGPGVCVSARCGLEARKDPCACFMTQRVRGGHLWGRLARMEKGAFPRGRGGWLRSLQDLSSLVSSEVWGLGAGNEGGIFLSRAPPSLCLATWGRVGLGFLPTGVLTAAARHWARPGVFVCLGRGLGGPGKAVRVVEPPGRRDRTVWEKVLPCSRPPESHWEVARVGSEPTAQGMGRAGAGPGAGGEGPWLASPSPDGGCGKLGEGMPGPFVLALLMAGSPRPPPGCGSAGLSWSPLEFLP